MDIAAKSRLHPLVAGAAIAVILFSLVGVAAVTGLIPGSKSADAPLVAGNGSYVNSSPSASNDGSSNGNGSNGPLNSAQKAAAERDAATPDSRNSDAPPPQSAAICDSCGRVESIREIRHAKKPSGIGIAAGAVLGGVLGNQVGSGNGRTLATVAGAVGGGYAGNEVEKRTQTTTSYRVIVRMENGKIREFPQSGEGWRVGDEVRVVHGALQSRD
ncbi:MAG: Outer rane lipoprotein [Herbaspirillum sp.]|jgi:outer membrane lipoprotein SlyB|nr:Outer rane lipoprotein [Herbaspirillum sp.]